MQSKFFNREELIFCSTPFIALAGTLLLFWVCLMVGLVLLFGSGDFREPCGPGNADVEAVVLDTNHNPVVGADVSAVSRTRSREERHVVTDETGRFYIEKVEVEICSTVDVTITASGYQSQTVKFGNYPEADINFFAGDAVIILEKNWLSRFRERMETTNGR